LKTENRHVGHAMEKLLLITEEGAIKSIKVPLMAEK